MKTHLSALAFLTVSSLASAGEFRCNHEQTLCYTSRKDFTVGDEVGFVSENNKLLARGVIEKIRNQERTIKVDKRFGPIVADARLVVLNDKSHPADAYQEFRAPQKTLIGGSVQLLSVQAGSGLSTFMGTGNFEYRLNKFFFVGGEADLFSGSGTVTRPTSGTGSDTVSAAISGLAVLGMATARVGEDLPVSGHFGAGLGLLYMNGTVNSDAASFDDADFATHMHNGIGMSVRLFGAATWNLSPWYLDGGATMMMLNDATAPGLFIAAYHDL